MSLTFIALKISWFSSISTKNGQFMSDDMLLTLEVDFESSMLIAINSKSNSFFHPLYNSLIASNSWMHGLQYVAQNDIINGFFNALKSESLILSPSISLRANEGRVVCDQATMEKNRIVTTNNGLFILNFLQE